MMNRLNDWVKTILFILFYLGLLSLSIWWKVWSVHQIMKTTGFSFWKAFFVFR